ncbi:F-box-like/WD repeat-containing protein TBL1Y [Favolaschia claudopus]|uniref:F-box-like/WD repeat-containing protein TBL1Y n=1 Tax=Favolaschia claudopus TaxID=2862362 RepID=A0AAW0CJQ4_9AGAR
MTETQAPLRLTSDEINCLVYSFLLDSGFKHAAFSLAMEGRLENSPNFSKHIPRGELIDLLSKSLLYQEVECHWKADHLALNCRSEFSLLERHVCSLEPPKPKLIWPQPPQIRLPLGQSNLVNGVSDGKRKASEASLSPTVDAPAEKRPRRDPDAMDVDTAAVKMLKPKTRQQGPGDTETNPDAILVLPGHEAEVFVCAFNPVRQSVLVTGSKDSGVNLWELPYPPPATSPEFARPPGPPRRLEHFKTTDQPGDLTALHWNSEGSLIAIACYDSILRVYTVSGDLYFLSTHHQQAIFAVRFSQDGKWLLTASLDATTCLWDVNTKELKRIYPTQGCCLDIDWISNTLFASCCADQLIYIMDVEKPETVKTLSGHTNEVNQIKCNPSSSKLASCSDDMTARIWNIDNVSSAPESISDSEVSQQPVVLIGHKHSVCAVGWCPEHPEGTNQIIATASWDGTCRLWDSVTGECLHIFEDHKLPVYALKFSPSGRWIATGGSDGWLHVYDVKARKLTWSWFAGFDKPGMYEIDWQTGDDLDRIAVALECWKVAIIDVSKVPALQRK